MNMIRPNISSTFWFEERDYTATRVGETVTILFGLAEVESFTFGQANTPRQTAAEAVVSTDSDIQLIE